MAGAHETQQVFDNASSQKIVKESSSQESVKQPINQSESLAIREAPVKVQVPATQPPPLLSSHISAESRNSGPERHETAGNSNGSPTNLQSLEPFDWEGFEARYVNAIRTATENEAALLKEFADLVNYFGSWAEASLQFDEDRALKRIKTREAFIRKSEHSLEEKRKRYTQVVEAFKNALALLAGP